ncbi:TfoX/Sxy family DNA transformation protein [Rhizobiaceae sp. 2RAB30]
MSRPLAEMRNLGPATARMLVEVDITDEEMLRTVGPVEAWHRLRFRFGSHVTVIALYAMEAALTGCDWRSLSNETKARLQAEAGAALSE